MRRLLLAWLLAIPLVAMGSQLAHWLGYSLVASPDARAELLAATGHGYLAALPLLVTASAGLIAAVLVMVVADGFSGRASLGVQRWPFAVVPFVGFVTQELVERGVAGHVVSLGTLLEPPVLVGLLLQLPFAVLVYSVAHALTRVAVVLGRALAAQPREASRRLGRSSWPAHATRVPRPVWVAATPPRGPPELPLLTAT